MSAKVIASIGLALALGLAGCASSTSAVNQAPATLYWTSPQKRVVLMEARFDLYEAGAVTARKSRDDWNRHARTLAYKAIGDALAAKGIALVEPDALLPSEQMRAADYSLSLDVQNTYAGTQASDIATYAGLAGVSVLLPGVGVAAALMYLTGACDATGCVDQPQAPRVSSLSLADSSGSVIWSYRYRGGDWRSESSAKKAVQELLAGAPF